jgi:hypothetical protein
LPVVSDEPWVLDVDATIKPLYGHQEGAVVGYNPSTGAAVALLSQLRRFDPPIRDFRRASH